MKKLFLHGLSVSSILFLLLAARLFYAHFAGDNLGMTMIYLIPLLVIGLLLGTVAYLLARSLDEPLTGFWDGLSKFNLVLMGLGVAGLVYALFE